MHEQICTSEFETSFVKGRQKNSFLEHHNSFDPSLKFIHESSKESLPFLDLKVWKGKISTDLCLKDVVLQTSVFPLCIISSKPY